MQPQIMRDTFDEPLPTTIYALSASSPRLSIRQDVTPTPRLPSRTLPRSHLSQQYARLYPCHTIDVDALLRLQPQIIHGTSGAPLPEDDPPTVHELLPPIAFVRTECVRMLSPCTHGFASSATTQSRYSILTWRSAASLHATTPARPGSARHWLLVFRLAPLLWMLCAPCPATVGASRDPATMRWCSSHSSPVRIRTRSPLAHAPRVCVCDGSHSSPVRIRTRSPLAHAPRVCVCDGVSRPAFASTTSPNPDNGHDPEHFDAATT
ncbi:hypothetical protein MSAN_01368500 [Mycena sanguinolenta]|uniref:Uncharacterized protein n=1 Tax=Mycena sanguinolenta TaxID=230812 RepID=A0A8H6Y8V2_9AGAR|nr:hypothetical protein MSAN_01368500 [Mycena sanguinolenta]